VATFFAAAGIQPPATFHGSDLTPLLKDSGAAWPHACLYEHTGHDFGDAVAKLLRTDPKSASYVDVPWYTAVVLDQWKYIRYLRPGEPEELTNLAGQPKQ